MRGLERRIGNLEMSLELAGQEKWVEAYLRAGRSRGQAIAELEAQGGTT